jgi:hypothetical protein
MSTSEKNWWYLKGENRFGPFSPSELRELAKNGEIIGTDLLWKDGLQDWIPATKVKGLIPAQPSIQSTFIKNMPPIPKTTQEQSSPQLPPQRTRTSPKNQSVLKRYIVYVTIMFFGLIFIGAILSPENGSKGKRSGGKTSSTNEVAKNIRIGQSFTTKNFDIQIEYEEKRYTVGRRPFDSEPAEGGFYVAIKWNYKNISKKPINTFSAPSIYLKDENGSLYSPDIGASSSYATEIDLDRKILSNLNPGITVTDADVFEVSRNLFNSKTWKIVVDDDQNYEIPFNSNE